MKLKRTGTLETVATIICFTVLLYKTDNPLWLIPMGVFALLYLGFDGD